MKPGGPCDMFSCDSNGCMFLEDITLFKSHIYSIRKMGFRRQSPESPLQPVGNLML